MTASTCAPRGATTASERPLTGRSIIVTGASRGIGRAIATELGRQGADLLLVSRSVHDLQSLTAALGGGGTTVDYFSADITDVDCRRDLLALPFSLEVDALVNAAGMNVPAAITNVTADDFDQVFDLNVRATFLLTQGVARRMLDRGRGGSIVTITSQMGHVGAANRSVYCASKHALEGMTKALAVELGPAGIRVNSVAPTFVETDMTRQWLQDESFRGSVLDAVPLGRLVSPQEVAACVAFLLGAGATGITGTSVLVDGGWTAR